MPWDEGDVRACWKSNFKFFSNFEAEEAWRRYSDHLGWTVKDGNCASDDRVLAAELALPKCIADDYAEGLAARPIIFRCEEPASDRNNSEQRKHLPARPKALNEPPLLSLSDGSRSREPGEKSGECPVLCSDLLPDRSAKRHVVRSQPEALKSALNLHPDQGRGVGYGKTSQTHGIQQLKNGRVRANAERECDDGDCSERGAFAQGAQSESQILKLGLSPELATGIAPDIGLPGVWQRLSASRSLEQPIPPAHRVTLSRNATLDSSALQVRARRSLPIPLRPLGTHGR